MNKIINSRYFKWFRKLYLKDLYKHIKEAGNSHRLVRFCCHYEGNYSIFISWKDLKEVKENMDSETLDRYGGAFTCNRSWFLTNYDRRKFLEECLAKF